MTEFINDHLWVAGLYFLVAILVVCGVTYCLMRYVWKWLSYPVIPGIAALLIAMIAAPVLWATVVHFGFVVFSFVLVVALCAVGWYFSYKDDTKDDPIYWAALGVAIAGPALGFIFGLKQEVDGPVTIPWGIILVVIAVVALTIFLVRKYRPKKVTNTPKST